MKKVLLIFVLLTICVSAFFFYDVASKVSNKEDTQGKNYASTVTNSKVFFGQLPNVKEFNINHIELKSIKDYFGNSAKALSVPIVVAQKNDSWARTFGGHNRDAAYSIQQTSDRGYIVAGGTEPFGADKNSPDCLVMRLDSGGNPEWAETFGGSGPDYIMSVLQSSDGGYVVAGSLFSESSRFGCLIMKFDPDRRVLWAEIAGGNYNDFGTSIQQTSDGGYIACGYSESFGADHYACLVMKFNSMGRETWAKIFDGGNYYDDWASSIQQTSDGGYIVAGGTRPFSKDQCCSDCLIMKLDSNGDVSWAKTFGGNGTDYADSIRQTSDGEYIVTGSFFREDSGYDCLIMKLDSNGDVSWAKTFGGGYNDYATSVRQTLDGGYIATGTTRSFGAGRGDFLFIKLDSEGNVDWVKTFGGEENDYAMSVRQTLGEGYIACGYSKSFGAGDDDSLIVKLNSDGDIPGGHNYLRNVEPIVTSLSIPENSLKMKVKSVFPSVYPVNLAIHHFRVQMYTICGRGSTALINYPLFAYFVVIALIIVAFVIIFFVMRRKIRQ